jgi:hypothetical protein
MTRALHNRIATLFRHSALDAESSYFKQFWIPACAGMTYKGTGMTELEHFSKVL